MSNYEEFQAKLSQLVQDPSTDTDLFARLYVAYKEHVSVKEVTADLTKMRMEAKEAKVYYAERLQFMNKIDTIALQSKDFIEFQNTFDEGLGFREPQKHLTDVALDKLALLAKPFTGNELLITSRLIDEIDDQECVFEKLIDATDNSHPYWYLLHLQLNLFKRTSWVLNEFKKEKEIEKIERITKDMKSANIDKEKNDMLYKR